MVKLELEDYSIFIVNVTAKYALAFLKLKTGNKKINWNQNERKKAKTWLKEIIYFPINAKNTHIPLFRFLNF